MTLEGLWYGLFVAVIAAYLVLDGFDLGVGMLHPFVARTDDERRISLNSIGPIWDGNEVWLVVGGGVLFGAFPVVYASLFSGFYLALMLVLLFLILRTVSIEFRSKRDS
ncbi:MAG TPA: cytochrome d ubiquinol oxidase subunit II, partial [Actinomycetota bacterium]|nr:cytochrome d ubiquinol oxidase subunit II [Actinomycetota bacterium]